MLLVGSVIVFFNKAGNFHCIVYSKTSGFTFIFLLFMTKDSECHREKLNRKIEVEAIVLLLVALFTLISTSVSQQIGLESSPRDLEIKIRRQGVYLRRILKTPTKE